MRVFVKTKCVYSFTINLQSKLKNSAHYFWKIDQEKLPTKFNKVSECALWVGDARNFHNKFFVKNELLKLNFFSSTAECYP